MSVLSGLNTPVAAFDQPHVLQGVEIAVDRSGAVLQRLGQVSHGNEAARF